jgi:hypothetical protein
MRKKLKCVFPDRPLTPQEATADRDVRRKVEAEFPPRLGIRSDEPSPLRELLENAFGDSGKSVELIAQESGVPTAVVTRFLAGDRDIHLATADLLVRSLGLEVVAAE